MRADSRIHHRPSLSLQSELARRGRAREVSAERLDFRSLRGGLSDHCKDGLQVACPDQIQRLASRKAYHSLAVKPGGRVGRPGRSHRSCVAGARGTILPLVDERSVANRIGCRIVVYLISVQPELQTGQRIGKQIVVAHAEHLSRRRGCVVGRVSALSGRDRGRSGRTHLDLHASRRGSIDRGDQRIGTGIGDREGRTGHRPGIEIEVPDRLVRNGRERDRLIELSDRQGRGDVGCGCIG